MDDLTRDHGPQPIDALMRRWHLENHDLVAISTDQLTHKQVQRARKGRQLTHHLMQKITRTFNAAILAQLNAEERKTFAEYPQRQLFSYAKGHDPAWQDPNGTPATSESDA